MRLLLLAVLFTPAVCAAQAPPPAPELETDRPGFGESSGVVARGTIQIESGLTVERPYLERRNDASVQVLGRVGVASRLELRVEAEGSDAEIGGKVNVSPAALHRVKVAVIPYLSLPADGPGGGRAHDPGFKVAASADLPWAFGLSGTFNAADVSGETDRAWQRETSISIDHGFPHGFGAFAEIDDARGCDRCGVSLDGGLTIAVGRDAQVDVEAGRGLHGPVQDWFVGAGLVFRTPPRTRHK